MISSKFFLIVLLTVTVPLFSNESDSLVTDVDDKETQLETWRLVTTGLFATGAISYSSTQFVRIWGSSERSSWHWKHDDFLDDGYAQSDEISHFVAGQRMSQLGRALCLWTGFDERTSTIIGASVSIAISLAVEIYDAFNPREGFGYSDLIFGVGGAYFDIARRKYPALERFDIRVSFEQFKHIPQNLVIAEHYKSYDNTIYWLTYQPSMDIPFDICFGYSTGRDYSQNLGPLPTRQLYLGVGISGRELMRLFYNDIPDNISGLLSWYEFTVYAKLYESRGIHYP